MTDLTFVVKNAPSESQSIDAKNYALENEIKSILVYTNDSIITVDLIGSPSSCLFDSRLASVIGNIEKVVGWYDNEVGYSK